MQKKIKKLGLEINEIENIVETKSWFFGKINRIDESLDILIRKNRRVNKLISKITTNTTNIKRSQRIWTTLCH